MANNTNNDDKNAPGEIADDSEDDSEILEESPCGRWSKRRQEVQQRDVPGIDTAYLAMDSEEGVEVVWNEADFSKRRNFKAQEEKITQVFDNLTELDHPNIVKLHKYWIDTKNDQRRVVFITEYMSSGSLKKFLKLTKRNVKKLPLQSWKRWCTQILSALSYLHSCSPPIIHGNLTTDSIFIQHNGLVKIGSVAPDAIQTHVKTCRGDMKNMHYIAPEYGTQLQVTPAVDIFSFGICALEIAAFEITGNGDSGTLISQEQIQKTINSLEHRLQKEFITQCLRQNPDERPEATKLLFHPVLFEVHSLKLLAAHSIIHNPRKSNKYMDDCLEDILRNKGDPERIVATIIHRGRENTNVKMSDIPVVEKLDKFIEDVRYGIYPITVFRLPATSTNGKSAPPECSPITIQLPQNKDFEPRRVVAICFCAVRPTQNGEGDVELAIVVRFNDWMSRQMACVVNGSETARELAEDLVAYGLIHEDDEDKLSKRIEMALIRYREFGVLPQVNGDINNLEQNPPVLPSFAQVMTAYKTLVNAAQNLPLVSNTFPIPNQNLPPVTCSLPTHNQNIPPVTHSLHTPNQNLLPVTCNLPTGAQDLPEDLKLAADRQGLVLNPHTQHSSFATQDLPPATRDPMTSQFNMQKPR